MSNWDDISWGVAGLLALFLIAVGLFTALNAVSRNSCQNTAQMMGFEHTYSFSTGCLIKVDGSFIPVDAYRRVAE